MKISSIDFCIEHVDQVNRICAAKVDDIRAEGAKVNRVCLTILLIENHKDIETDRNRWIRSDSKRQRCYTFIQWMIFFSANVPESVSHIRSLVQEMLAHLKIGKAMG